MPRGRPDLSLARDHHLGGLDDRERFVAAAEVKFLHGVARDDRGQPLVADSQPDLRDHSALANLLDDAAKLLQETLDEEEATDQALTEIAETVVNQEGQAEAA